MTDQIKTKKVDKDTVSIEKGTFSTISNMRKKLVAGIAIGMVSLGVAVASIATPGENVEVSYDASKNQITHQVTRGTEATITANSSSVNHHPKASHQQHHSVKTQHKQDEQGYSLNMSSAIRNLAEKNHLSLEKANEIAQRIDKKRSSYNKWVAKNPDLADLKVNEGDNAPASINMGDVNVKMNLVAAKLALDEYNRGDDDFRKIDKFATDYIKVQIQDFVVSTTFMDSPQSVKQKQNEVETAGKALYLLDKFSVMDLMPGYYPSFGVEENYPIYEDLTKDVSELERGNISMSMDDSEEALMDLSPDSPQVPSFVDIPKQGYETIFKESMQALLDVKYLQQEDAHEIADARKTAERSGGMSM